MSVSSYGLCIIVRHFLSSMTGFIRNLGKVDIQEVYCCFPSFCIYFQFIVLKQRSYNKTVSIDIVHMFLNLFDKHFHDDYKLHEDSS